MHFQATSGPSSTGDASNGFTVGGSSNETVKTGAVKKESASSNASRTNASGKRGEHQQPTSSSQDVKEVFYKFDIGSMRCHIQDYEHNHFRLDLGGPTPLQPKLDLAGEVEGLKPTAVTDAPSEPKIFIAHRDGSATEVVCCQVAIIFCDILN